MTAAMQWATQEHPAIITQLFHWGELRSTPCKIVGYTSRSARVLLMQGVLTSRGRREAGKVVLMPRRVVREVTP